MPEILSELMKLLFQPPVLILFALAVAGLGDLLQRRSDYRNRVNMEWRVRESFYRDLGWSDGLIARVREQFYQRSQIRNRQRKA